MSDGLAATAAGCRLTRDEVECTSPNGRVVPLPRAPHAAVMKRTSLLSSIIVASSLLLQGARAQSAVDLGPQPPGRFDFYVLSLTWVPGFCASHSDPTECGLDLGFKLHGLWPESMTGYPSNCSSDPLPENIRAAYVGLFPSPQMIDHEWLKHGTCTGLGPAEFFEKTQNLLRAITVPLAYQRRANLRSSDAATIKSAFLAANSNLMAGSIVLSCAGQRISEIHVCLRKDDAARVCEDWERAEDNCR
jgi:ribonuclease T2